MYRYILKRIALLIPIILGVTFIIFTIVNITPGDPGRILLGRFAPQEAVDRLNEELGQNKPFFTRYAMYIGNAVRGDFGISYRTKRPVFDEVLLRFPTTLKLAAFSVSIAMLIGIPIGILSAVKQYSKVDSISMVTAIFMASIPDFWLGLMMIIIFALKLGWLPSSGIDNLLGFVMPSLALGLPVSAMVLRLTRATMLETLRQDYIRTARAKAVSERTIIWKHALKNALLPIITVVGMQFGYLLGGAIIVETVFAVPGLGSLTVNSIRTKDFPQIVAAIIFLAVLFVLIMLIIDLIYAFVDPRIKSKFQ